MTPRGGATRQALPLYKQVDDVLGEANSTQSLGDIDEANGTIASAMARWREALALYAKLRNSYAMGCVLVRLASRAPTPEEAAEHVDAARRAWTSINRQDLIKKHLGKGL